MAKNQKPKSKTTGKKKPAKKSTRRPGVKRKPSKKKLLELIFEYGCVTDIADVVQVSRKQVHVWIKNDKTGELKQAMEDARDNLVDLAKSGLRKNIQDGKEKSIIYVLSTLGRKEGFGNFIQVQDRSKLDEQLDEMTDEQILEAMSESNRRMNKAVKGEK